MERSPDRRALIGALLLGAIAAGLIVAYLASRDSGSGAAPARSLSVLVATQDIAAGTEITSQMVGLRSIPEQAVLADAATSLADAVGNTARYPIPQGAQISPSLFVDTPSVQALSFQIPAGMRGFTIPVDITKSPAAVLAPGDFVDVIVTAEIQLLGLEAATPVAEDDDPPRGAVTLLQNLQVLAVQRTFVQNGVVYDSSVRGTPPEEESVTYVTLAVAPNQAQLLWLATQEGAVTLSLRAFGDDTIVDVQPVTEPVRLP
ncbi:MAG TPA: Flp pilus assembly protein CpaB [Tepidiformaceae bacterium]|nr:Flp pilus assembly protein CpaB [Tepidiformaceae bacterium]